MKRLQPIGALLALLLFLTGCAAEPVPTEAQQQPPVLAKHQPAKPQKHVVAQRFTAFLKQRVQNRGFEKNRGELGGNAELPETQFQNETVLRYKNTAFSSFPKIGRIFA